jgi:hypothetical protein
MKSTKKISVLLALVALLPIKRPMLLVLAILLYAVPDEEKTKRDKSPVGRT